MHDFKEHIEVNPSIVLGKPVIKGTRITVESIVSELSAGYGFDGVLKAHPHLTRENVMAALQYSSEKIKPEFEN